MGTALGRAPGSMGKASWGDHCEGAVGGASLGVSQGSGERDGNGVPAGRGVAHRLASQEPASLPLGRGAEALGQLLSDTRDIVALTSAQCRPLETRSSVGFVLGRALRGGAALPLSPEGLAEDGAAARSHEWTEAVCAEAVATWRKPTWGAGSAGGGGSPFRSDPASFPSTLEIARHFRFGSQEDAHEFLRYTIDAMQKACLSGCARCGGRAPRRGGGASCPLLASGAVAATLRPGTREGLADRGCSLSEGLRCCRGRFSPFQSHPVTLLQRPGR